MRTQRQRFTHVLCMCAGLPFRRKRHTFGIALFHSHQCWSPFNTFSHLNTVLVLVFVLIRISNNHHTFMRLYSDGRFAHTSINKYRTGNSNSLCACTLLCVFNAGIYLFPLLHDDMCMVRYYNTISR